MSRAKIFILIFLLLIILTFPSQAAAALNACPIRTDPYPLENTHRAAGFYINIGDSRNYPLYRMEFQCGGIPFALTNKVDATKINDKEIYVGLDKSSTRAGTPCEFDADPKKRIMVYAVINDKEVPQCEAFYQVVDSATQCTLNLDPEEGITSATTLNVYGRDIASQTGGLVLFFDSDPLEVNRFLIDVPGTGDVSMPSFGPKTIPTELMTPGNHIISLRQKKNTSAYLNPLIPTKQLFGPALCPLQFNVGTPDKPGRVSEQPTALSRNCSLADIRQGKCSSAGGLSIKGCTDDKNNPAIATAIGCIHTNPVEFTKDIMKFVLGIAGGLAFLMMLLGAFQILSSADNPDTLKAGRERLTSGVIGLLLVIFAILLLQIIGIGILRIPGFTPP